MTLSRTEARKMYKDLYNEYSGFFSILHELDSYVSDDSDNVIIDRYVEEYDAEIIYECLIQGRKMLEMEPFPNELIDDIINGAYFDPEETKKWLESILNSIEQEARKAGKIS